MDRAAEAQHVTGHADTNCQVPGVQISPSNSYLPQ